MSFRSNSFSSQSFHATRRDSHDVDGTSGASQGDGVPESLIRQMLGHGKRDPGAPAYYFVHGPRSIQTVSRGEVITRARLIAVALGRCTQRGERVVVALPQSLEFIDTFLGCLLSGRVAVPCNLPRGRNPQSIARLKRIVKDAQASLLITSDDVLEMLNARAAVGSESSGTRRPQFTGFDQLVELAGQDGSADVSDNALPGADDLAFLQYTSGATGAPKGVVVTHGNLAANERAMQHALGHTAQSLLVSWLPFFHDMGLVCGLLQPLYVGFPAVLMSPALFLKHPELWLQAVTDYRATTIGGPNFAFDYCADRITDEQRARLDLRSLTVAFNGSEPVRAATLERFARRFEPVGFQRSVFFPCYGLAEATLIVSGGAPGRDWITCQAPSEQESGSLARQHVGCGQIAQDTEVRIVDRETRLPLPAGEVGEIWVRGSSVARGYWNQAEPTERTFCATLATEPPQGPYLRTGDLGFLSDGQLFITGRCKDMLIVRGRNIDPLDIEQLFLEVTGTGRINSVAAVSIEEDDREQLYLLVEASSDARKAIRDAGRPGALAPLDELTHAIHQSLVARLDVPLRGIAFVRPGRLPRTTSGKLARQACREMLSQEGPDLLYVARIPDADGKLHGTVLELLKMHLREAQRSATDATNPAQAKQQLDDAAAIPSSLAMPEPTHLTSVQQDLPWPFDPSQRLSAAGLDSLARTSLFTDLEKQLGVTIAGQFREHDPTWGELIAVLQQESRDTNDTKTVAAIHGHEQVDLNSDDSKPAGRDPAGHNQPRAADTASRALRFDSAETHRPLACGNARGAEPDPGLVCPLPQSVDGQNASFSDFEQRMTRDLLAKTRDFSPWLNQFDASGHKRYLLPVLENRGGRALVGADQAYGQREVMLYCSADYLGLAHDPRLKLAATRAVIDQGCNVASVPLVAGSTEVHRMLEEQLADWLGKEACVLFPTGQSANSATIAALCSERDSIVVDNQVHCSVLEGVRLSRAHWRTFLHNDAKSLAEVLTQVRQVNPERGVLVIVEGVYGIDGDVANLAELIEVARRFEARVMVDDAHGIGVIGENGRGSVDAQQVTDQVDILMGSLSKSLGSFGGFVLASREVIDYLRFFAKSISFAVGMPAINAAVALEALKVIREEPQRVAELQRKARLLRDELLTRGFRDVQASQSSIMSIEVGSEDRLREISRLLFERGVWAEPLPFPAVPRGRERVRFRVRYVHTDADLLETAETVAQVLRDQAMGTDEHDAPPAPGAPSAPSAHQASSDAPTSDVSITMTPRWNVTDSLDLPEARELTTLIQTEARANNVALPWVAPDLMIKYFAQADYWRNTRGPLQWHRLRVADKTLAAFCVERRKVSYDGRLRDAALVGSFAYRSELLPELMARVSAVCELVGSETELLALPAMHPVYVFGAGIPAWLSAEEKPLLEQAYPIDFCERIGKIGYEPLCQLDYTRLELTPDRTVDTRQLPASSEVTVREFRREALAQEAAWLTLLINRTLARLPLAATVSETVVLGLLKDLRELIRPGFWLVAQRHGRPIGFVFAYPNITSAFREAYGNADIADFQALGQAMEAAREVFVAWLAVDPEFAGQQVSQKLLDTLFARLRSQGYRHAWLSWEMVDGSQLDSRMTGYGKIVQHASLPVPGSYRPTQSSPEIPAPHLGQRPSRSRSDFIQEVK